MNKWNKVSFTMIIVGTLMISIGLVWSMIDFCNDYKCSTTTDINYFIENNCQRYMK